MSINRIYAHLSCTDLDASIVWFETLFGKAPDARPMTGLAEWHHAGTAGLQLFENGADAGHGTLTVIVSGLSDERERLADLQPGDIEEATTTSIFRLQDPDGNLVVLAEPKQA
ncbi:VOC family protein [Pararhizobium sp.]|uniref:VOC family protein n=1 Tax=Pararhizobium sp. TaxID=1977563 RepID=UPI00271BAFA8|nr:VOC family protein [Pararhizobium sp.]MDO9414738.1 VOC family protein [Pararhizobium sp.]